MNDIYRLMSGVPSRWKVYVHHFFSDDKIAFTKVYSKMFPWRCQMSFCLKEHDHWSWELHDCHHVFRILQSFIHVSVWGGAFCTNFRLVPLTLLYWDLWCSATWNGNQFIETSYNAYLPCWNIVLYNKDLYSTCIISFLSYIHSTIFMF